MRHTLLSVGYIILPPLSLSSFVLQPRSCNRFLSVLSAVVFVTIVDANSDHGLQSDMCSAVCPCCDSSWACGGQQYRKHGKFRKSATQPQKKKLKSTHISIYFLIFLKILSGTHNWYQRQTRRFSSEEAEHWLCQPRDQFLHGVEDDHAFQASVEKVVDWNWGCRDHQDVYWGCDRRNVEEFERHWTHVWRSQN